MRSSWAFLFIVIVLSACGREDKPNSNVFREAQKLLAIEGSPGDHFGFSVAVCDSWAIDGSGNIIDGAHSDDDSSGNSGSAYMFAIHGR